MRRRARRDEAPVRPRLLILVTLAERGGVVSYLSGLIPGLVGEFDVTVAAYGPGPLGERMRAAGAEYVELRHVRRPISPLTDARGLLELIALCRQLRPHVLHANSTKAGLLGRLAAWLTRVPVRIFSSHGWAFATHPGATSRVYLWCDRIMRPLTTTTICVSQSELARGLRARTCTARRTVVIPNGISLEVPRARVGDEDGPARIVTVGRMAAPKDFVTVVRALARLPADSYRAQFVGDGPDRAEIQREIERHDSLSITLAGERGDVPARLAESDVFVLSSHSEAMPMVVLEAMAAGLPVVASAVGGVPELIVDGDSGVLFAPGDVDALAAALEQLAADGRLRQRLGGSARARAEQRHSLDEMRRQYAELYRSELAARGVAMAP
jgi:glycosyltransferase involved in cell wall biosynthesis